MAESDPMRWVVLALLAAGLFVLGLFAFIDHTVTQATAEAKARVGLGVQRMEARGTPLLDRAAAVAGPFVTHVGAGHFAEAHALMAAPYRRVVSIDAFARACRSSALLAGARSVTLRSLRRQTAGDATTLEGSGVLDSTLGAVPVDFVFIEEPSGPRILVLSVAGVPVLQGVTSTDETRR